jgi:hypothetical protein
MFDNNELYNLLAAGHSAEDIVALFTTALNEAEDTIRKEEEAKRAAEEAKALESAKKAARKEDLVILLRDAEAYCRSYFPTLLGSDQEMSEEGWNAVADLVLSLLDMEVAKHTTKVQMHIQPKSKKTKLPVKLELTTDDIFADFFKQMGL